MNDKTDALALTLAKRIVNDTWECSMCGGDLHPAGTSHGEAVHTGRRTPGEVLTIAAGLLSAHAEIDAREAQWNKEAVRHEALHKDHCAERNELRAELRAVIAIMNARADVRRQAAEDLETMNRLVMAATLARDALTAAIAADPQAARDQAVAGNPFVLSADEREALRKLTCYTSEDLPDDAFAAYNAIDRLLKAISTPLGGEGTK